MTVTFRNPVEEAQRALQDPTRTPLLLEPSPPANQDPEFFADDPAVGAPDATGVVSPFPGREDSWSALVQTRPDLAGFVSDRWLGSFKRLEALPPRYTETRESLHQVAFFAVAPKRHSVNGKIGLRYTYHGFGTPFFGNDEQARVQDGLLVHQVGDEVRTSAITTVRDACDALGIPYVVEWFPNLHDPLTPIGPDAPLAVDVDAAGALGDWFGFATSVLEELRHDDGVVDPSRVQLWCEHFDPAMEIGSAERNQRASFGASPGDGSSQQPYLYVAPWSEVEADPYWNASGFTGASLSYDELLGADDQRQVALDFFRKGWQKLAS